MSRVIIDDRWIKKDTPSRAKHMLNQAKNPLKARIPEQYKTSTFGQGARWRARWYQQGKQHSKSFNKREEAEAFKAAMEDDIRRGRYHDPRQESKPLQDIASEWIKSKVDLRQSTRDRYTLELSQYILPTFGQKSIGSITTRQIQDFVTQLQEGTYTKAETRTHETRPLSARSIRSIIKIVFADVMQYAVENKWITSNPATGVNIPKPQHRELQILTPQQIQDLANTVREVGSESDKTLVLFQTYTGARIGETTALQVKDINFDKHTARIAHTWSTTASGNVLMPPKNGRARTIAIPSFLMPSLKELTKNKNGSDFVFTSHKGLAINVRNWRNRVWYPALKLAGIDKNRVTIHSLRHSYASMAVAAGADVKTLQQQLGHSSASITLDVYASLWPSKLGDVAEAINRFRSDSSV